MKEALEFYSTGKQDDKLDRDVQGPNWGYRGYRDMHNLAATLETELNRLAKAHKALLDHHYWPEFTAKAMQELGLNATDYE